VLLDLIPLVIAGAIGLRLQRWSGGERFRARLWQGNYMIVLPVAATYAFLSIDIDRQRIAAIACGLVAWWLTVGAAWLWARAVTPDRSMRGALTLVAAFPNTSFVGYPLAHLAYGTEGLRYAVIYDQVSLIAPAIVVATVIARAHASAPAPARTPSTFAIARRGVLMSPPLWTVLMLITLRATIVHDPIQLTTLGAVVGRVVGPIGFLLLGLSIPLHGFSHSRRELLEVAGASLVRLAGAPLLVWLVATATGTHVPHALYLIAAMPTAFLSLVVARLHDLQVATVRLGIVMTTTVGVAAVVGWVALR
jgi:predicted permease